MSVMLAFSGAVFASSGRAPLRSPPWNFSFPTASEFCVGLGNAEGFDPRWVFAALPEGPAPPQGFPVVLWLLTDQSPTSTPGNTCGKPGLFTRKHYSAWATPAASMQSCFMPPANGRLGTPLLAPGVETGAPPPGGPPIVFPPSAAPYWGCSAMVTSLCGEELPFTECMACVEGHSAALARAGCAAGMLPHACMPFEFDTCQAALNTACGGSGASRHLECDCALSPENVEVLADGNCTAYLMRVYGCDVAPTHCMYDQQAGQLWDQRAKQYFVANGVAVIQINPSQDVYAPSAVAPPYTDFGPAPAFRLSLTPPPPRIHTRHMVLGLSKDTWDADPKSWASGPDRPFIASLFAGMAAGAFGHLDVGSTLVRGWSGGASMVSWMYELQARAKLPAGVVVKGGFLLSGGSFMCYTDPFAVPGAQPPTTCRDCVNGGGEDRCFGSPPDPKCSSCGSGPTYCSQCCPGNYTEPYFEEHPAECEPIGTARVLCFFFPVHAAVSLTNKHSDDERRGAISLPCSPNAIALCGVCWYCRSKQHRDRVKYMVSRCCSCLVGAGKKYYETLRAHGVKTELVLVPRADERCFCVGTPSEPAASGSPFLEQCTSSFHTCDTDCCVAHTLGFAAMVEPMTSFALEIVGR